MNVTREQVVAVLATRPAMSSHGLVLPRIRPVMPPLAYARAELLTTAGLDEIGRCADWLADAPRNSRATADSPNSYAIKHLVEVLPPARYVSNGSAIAAALVLGIPVEEPGPLNPGIGIGRRWFQAEWERVMNP